MRGDISPAAEGIEDAFGDKNGLARGVGGVNYSREQVVGDCQVSLSGVAGRRRSSKFQSDNVLEGAGIGCAYAVSSAKTTLWIHKINSF